MLLPAIARWHRVDGATNAAAERAARPAGPVCTRDCLRLSVAKAYLVAAGCVVTDLTDVDSGEMSAGLELTGLFALADPPRVDVRSVVNDHAGRSLSDHAVGGSAFAGMPLGSVSTAVLRPARCPVAVVP